MNSGESSGVPTQRGFKSIMPTTPSRAVTIYTFQFVPSPTMTEAKGSAYITFRQPVGDFPGTITDVIDFSCLYSIGTTKPLVLFGRYPNSHPNSSGALSALSWTASTISVLALLFISDDGITFSVTESQILSTVTEINGSWAFLEKYTVGGPIIKGPAL
jgi:hypothetical protein